VINAMRDKYDLIIIGGGAAAFSAAIKANIHGVKALMIERAALGGTCVNVGCIPSKNLLGAGEILHLTKNPPYPSIFPCDSKFDFRKTVGAKDNLVKSIRKQKYHDVLSSLENVELIEASASFVAPNKIKANGKALEADKFIIATGSSPSIPRFKGIENVDYLTNNETLSLKEKPSSMIVVGGRALGLEFAQMYARFGTKVTLLQRSGKIIPEHEPEISDALHNYLTEEGIEIVTGVNVKEVYQKGNSKFLIASVNGDKKTQTFEAEQLLMATGRKPNTADLHLENAGVKCRPDGAIAVNSEMHTCAAHIWAGGDVIGEPMLETLAAKEGATAAENALTGTHKKIDLLSVPSAIFTSPQVASVGMTEEQMTQKYGYCSCRTLAMNDVPKALTVNDTKGLIKMAVDPKKDNRIVGVHILASMAADMIHEAVMAVKYRLAVNDIIDTVHVFPTMSEAIKLVATSFKQDVSKLSCCAE
jgi:mercuric reductase